MYSGRIYINKIKNIKAQYLERKAIKLTSMIHSTFKKILKASYNLLLICLFVINEKVSSQDIVVTEINYHADTTRTGQAESEFIELYNRSANPVDITNWVITDSDDTHFFLFPGTTVLNAGEYLVVVQDEAKFTDKYPSVTNYISMQDAFGLGNKGDKIRLFDASATLHFMMEFADSMGWPKLADGHGRTLEIKNVNGNFSDPTNWMDGCMFGSPGSARTACAESIIFTEVNYNSSPGSDVGDWVELKNVSGQTKDISNYILRDKNDSNAYVFPSNVQIPPGGYIVIAEDPAKFNTRFPSVGAIGGFNFNFKNSKDIIRLFTGSGAIKYSLQYKDEYPWPVGADGYGYTLEIIDENALPTEAGNWKTGCLGGSPGTFYNTACLVGIKELNMLSYESKIYPNPITDVSYLEIILNENKSEPKLVFYDVIGNIADVNIFVTSKHNNSWIYQINKEDIAPGIYFYDIIFQEGKYTGKLIVAD